MKKKDKKLIVAILIVVLLMIVIPLFALKGAEFGGSDDAGSQVVEEISGDYEPWFTPILETLMFCVQTGIGVGIIAFLMGRFVERKKWEDKKQEN